MSENASDAARMTDTTPGAGSRADGPSQPDPAQPDPAQPKVVPGGRAPLRRGWLIKVLIFFVICVGISIWAYVDAVSIYPARGERVAAFYEYQYLGEYALANNGNMTNAGSATPVERFAELESIANTRGLQPVELMQQNWFEALRIVGELRPERTSYAGRDPVARYQELAAEWQSANAPKPLKGYDIPSQWAILAVFAVLALYNLFLIGRAAATRYVYHPDDKRLDIPGGSFTPDDIDEIDKRKWDKFIILLKIVGGHPQLGGQTVRFDTYRHDHLETWLLEMEAAAFGSEDDVGTIDGLADAANPDPVEADRA